MTPKALEAAIEYLLDARSQPIIDFRGGNWECVAYNRIRNLVGTGVDVESVVEDYIRRRPK